LAALNFLFHDCCGTASGSRTHDSFPAETIDFFLRNTASERVVLAITVTQRDRKGCKKRFRMSAAEFNHQYIWLPCIVRNGFRIESMHVIPYERDEDSQTMLLYVYKLCWDVNVDTSDYELAIEKRSKRETLVRGFRNPV
jgi:hypothetical protein